MIENLVVNGASFTAGNSWAKTVAEHFDVPFYQNLAATGAGNFYICNSTQEYLMSQQLVPEKTMVLIMWTGCGGHDIRIAGEWWYHLRDKYRYMAQSTPWISDEENYYLFSGGLSNSWTQNSLTKKIFHWHYKLADPQVICRTTLMQFINLENFLKANNYQYRFIAHANYWNEQIESDPDGHYSLGYFCNKWSIYQYLNLDDWMYVNSNRDGLREFAKELNQLDSTGHPTMIAHQQYANQVIIPGLSTTAL